MVGRHLDELQCRGFSLGQGIIPQDGVGGVGNIGAFLRVANDDDLAQAGDVVRHLCRFAARVERLALVGVAVGRDHDDGLQLAQSVQRGGGPQVGGARGPGRAQAGGRQHRNDGLGDVGHVANDAIPRLDAHFAQERGQPRHPVVQFGIGEGAPLTRFVAEKNGDLIIAIAEQVLGKVEFRAHEPTRAREFVQVVDDLVVRARGANPRVVPHRRPKLWDILHRPGVEFPVVSDVETVLFVEVGDEVGDVRVAATFFRGNPKRLFHGGFPPRWVVPNGGEVISKRSILEVPNQEQSVDSRVRDTSA